MVCQIALTNFINKCIIYSRMVDATNAMHSQDTVICRTLQKEIRFVSVSPSSVGGWRENVSTCVERGKAAWRVVLGMLIRNFLILIFP